MQAIRVACIWCVFVGLLCGGRALAEEDHRATYVRGVGSIEAALGRTIDWIKTHEVAGVLVVFDRITFAPPPGQNEYSTRHLYAADMDAWVQALSEEAKTVRLLVTTTTEPSKPLSAGEEDWEATLRERVLRPWWGVRARRGLRPAAWWIQRALREARDVHRGRWAVVLVGGDVLPEAVIDPNRRPDDERGWRRHLLDPGSYWVTRTIVDTVVREEALLCVMTPEARFGTHGGASAAPRLPWTARPQRPLPDAFTLNGQTTGAVRWDMHVGARKRLAELQGRDRVRRRVSGNLGELLVVPVATPCRFLGTTPRWFEFHGGQLLESCHLPSGYGVPSYEAVVAATGGIYCVYPTTPREWKDTCVLDEALAVKLAPVYDEEGRRSAPKNYEHELFAGCEELIDLPLWSDHLMERTESGSWGCTQSWGGSGRFPYDAFTADEPSVLKRWSRELGETCVPAYEGESVRVQGLLEEWGQMGEPTSLRVRADLLLYSFDLAVSTFHLRALKWSIDRALADEDLSRAAKLELTYVPFLKLSDCMAPIGDSDASSHDVDLRSWEPPADFSRGYVGNLLDVSGDAPGFRAERDLASVLENTPDDLLAAARAVVASARALGSEFGQCAWGWAAYYTTVYTFCWRDGSDLGVPFGGSTDLGPPPPRRPFVSPETLLGLPGSAPR